jgi:hypothetical protein
MKFRSTVISQNVPRDGQPWRDGEPVQVGQALLVGTLLGVTTRGTGLTTRSDGVAVSNLVRVDLSGKLDRNTTIKHVRLACIHSIMEGPLLFRLIVVR